MDGEIEREGDTVPRRSTYDPNQLTLVLGYARDGLSNEQIAKNLGIAVSTLYEWQKRFPEFAEALARGKDVVDTEVENALLKRALGYDYAEIVAAGNGDRVQVVRHALPDVKAINMWLTSRRPLKWRNKQEVEHSTPEGRPLQVALGALSDEELTQLEHIVSRAALAGSDPDGEGPAPSP